MYGGIFARHVNYCKCMENYQFFRHVKFLRGVCYTLKACVLVGVHFFLNFMKIGYSAKVCNHTKIFNFEP